MSTSHPLFWQLLASFAALLLALVVLAVSGVGWVRQRLRTRRRRYR